MPAAGGEQAEVDRGSGDPLPAVLVAEGPHRTRGGGELEVERRLGDGKIPCQVPEVPGAGGEQGDMVEAVGPFRGAAQRVEDVLPVCEQLHHPGFGEHSWRQRPHQPGHRGLRIGRAETVRSGGGGAAPLGEQFGGGEVHVTGERGLDVAVEVVRECAGQRGEAVRVRGGERGEIERRRQVCDLVCDGPAGSRCRSAPTRVRQRGEHAIQCSYLGVEVGDDVRCGPV